MKLEGCSTIITGASRGIGLGIARSFARRGANTILVARNEQRLLAAQASLVTTYENQQHHIRPMDVSQARDWDNLFTGLKQVRILVNAAGITHYSLLPRTPLSTIDSVLATNLVGAIYGSRLACRSMLKSGGCIINVSSALAHRGGSGSTVYAASKAGLVGFTKALAEELGPKGIRCNAIAPGYISTDMVSGMSEEMKEMTIERTSIRRRGTIEEVAHAALFVVENDFLNGSTITLDGGLTYD